MDDHVCVSTLYHKEKVDLVSSDPHTWIRARRCFTFGSGSFGHLWTWQSLRSKTSELEEEVLAPFRINPEDVLPQWKWKLPKQMALICSAWQQDCLCGPEELCGDQRLSHLLAAPTQPGTETFVVVVVVSKMLCRNLQHDRDSWGSDAH